MGTSYLVNDLWARVAELEARLALWREGRVKREFQPNGQVLCFIEKGFDRVFQFYTEAKDAEDAALLGEGGDDGEDE